MRAKMCKSKNFKLTQIAEDFTIPAIEIPSHVLSSPSYAEYYVREVAHSLEYAVKCIINSLGLKRKSLIGDPYRDYVLFIKFNDSYEAVLNTLHMGEVYYLLFDGKRVGYIPSCVNVSKSYVYGIRNIALDIVDFLNLIERIEYVGIITRRRYGGSVIQIFDNDARAHGIEPDTVILTTFVNLNEAFFENLAGCVFRRLGYLVFHQGTASGMLNYVFTCPDIELVKGVFGRGYFIYEIAISALLNELCEPRVRFTTGACEVKGEYRQFGKGVTQLQKYLSYRFYNQGYVTVPLSMDREKEVKHKGLGLLTWNEDGKPYIIKPSKDFGNEKEVKILKEFILSLVNVHMKVWSQCKP